MHNSFYDLTININRLNKLFMQMVDLELKNNKIYDVNTMQALLIINIGPNSKHIGDADSGYHLGTNASYNINDLVKKGYLKKTDDKEDKRRAFVTLTDKGKELYDLLYGVIMSRLKTLQRLDIDVKNINEILSKLQVIF